MRPSSLPSCLPSDNPDMGIDMSRSLGLCLCRFSTTLPLLRDSSQPFPLVVESGSRRVEGEQTCYANSESTRGCTREPAPAGSSFAQRHSVDGSSLAAGHEDCGGKRILQARPSCRISLENSAGNHLIRLLHRTRRYFRFFVPIATKLEKQSGER